ncbi:dihydroxyacetone kinase subunit DhaK [Enhygromyxa salina]|uniref:Dihydroxyacetone kinase n=1 Tax=Enhygromyxa salina TaxID=215803 RepID=A0A2S9XP13_9BACT|nr:dihydroxyacetone kinase subunit DhaK [Enhygromyxa salina]PRP94595.1 Dihydroxyacetone kinase [Enhygromyxa salina]
MDRERRVPIMTSTNKRFINDKHSLVTEALDGMVALGGGNALARLDGYPHIKVVTRAQLDPSKVAVISGGGAGHEPAHAGFVGRGLLSAAVCGEVFASPSVEAVYAGIMAVTGDAGCVLIVKNYTGDRLNFGLAAERARAQGKRVQTVLIADDIAIPGSAQPRGVAGTLFVHKIAGHLAEQGADLDVVADAAQAAAGEIWSLGVSLETCSIPGQPAPTRLASDETELGLGIHGEPGVETIPIQPVGSIVALIVDRLAASLPTGDHRYAALINNLGAVPPIEMSLIAHEILRSKLGPALELVIGPAPLMTSLDMNGFSLSLLRLDELRRAALSSACAPAAWRAPVVPAPALELRPLPAKPARDAVAPSSNDRVERGLAALLHRLVDMQAELDALDAKIGDGDTGSTFATAARAIQARAGQLPYARPDQLLAALGEILGEAMGGSSGVLMSIFCTAAGQAYGRGLGWAAAASEGVARIQDYGGARLGDRTMIDALVPGFAALIASGDLSQAAAAAREGAERTANMPLAKAGRAAYLSAPVLAGVPDPGAVAVAAAFEAVRDALTNPPA